MDVRQSKYAMEMKKSIQTTFELPTTPPNPEISVTIAHEVQIKEITPERDEWDNECSFFLSALGFAVGLGNVWRFPYIVYKYGGGTFLVPYCIMLFSVGLPIFFMEFVIGQYSKSGPIKLFGHIAPIFKGNICVQKSVQF